MKADETAEYVRARNRMLGLWLSMSPEGWKAPWLDETDGNPLFSAQHPERRRGVRIVFHPANQGLSWYHDTFAKGEPEEVAELVIRVGEVDESAILCILRPWVLPEAEDAPPNLFDSADFYTCNEHEEEYHCETPAEAIAERVEEIGEVTALTVFAYRHVEVEDSWWEALALRLMEDAAEMWGDDFGAPPRKTLFLPAAKRDFREAVRGLFRGLKPWHCEEVGRREYTREQVQAIAERPAGSPCPHCSPGSWGHLP